MANDDRNEPTPAPVLSAHRCFVNSGELSCLVISDKVTNELELQWPFPTVAIRLAAEEARGLARVLEEALRNLQWDGADQMPVVETDVEHRCVVIDFFKTLRTASLSADDANEVGHELIKAASRVPGRPSAP